MKADAIYHIIVSGLTGAVFHKWVINKLQVRIPGSIFWIVVLGGLRWWFGHMDVFYYTVLNNAKNTQVVEGVVHVSHTQPYQGHTYGDKITVNGQPFDVDYFNAALGDKDTIAHGRGRGSY